MQITKIDSSINLLDITHRLAAAFAASRFTVHQIEPLPRQKGVSLTRVRLNQSKSYCGNHAKACENPTRKDRKGSWLEGADWVEFNDLVNEVFDRNQWSADIASAKGVGCIIRKQNMRRIRYDADTFLGSPGNGEWRWNYDGPPNHFQCCFDNPDKASVFPKGTPGRYRESYNVVG